MLPKQTHNVEVKDLIEELGKRELNRVIGKSMLHDENAMFKDVLAPYAPDILSSLKNEKNSKLFPSLRELKTPYGKKTRTQELMPNFF